MMEDKTQYEALVEELKKLANNFRDVVTEIGDVLAKILSDVEIPEEEEDTWEMKCPYEEGDKVFKLGDDGLSWEYGWSCMVIDESRFEQGNIFPTREAARLESKRRNLLTRFRAFRDECNGDWESDWENAYENKYFICKVVSELEVYVCCTGNSFATFGYFKNSEDCEKAIELFGDEIKKLFIDCECD